MHQGSPKNFATDIKKLEEIIDQLEIADIPLEEALLKFEAGIASVRAAQGALHAAEQRVQQLIDNSVSGSFSDLDES